MDVQISIERFKVVKQRERTARQLAIDAVIETITDQTWSFARWSRHLKGIPPHEILSKLASARGSTNIGRQFNYLIKEYKKLKCDTESFYTL